MEERRAWWKHVGEIIECSTYLCRMPETFDNYTRNGLNTCLITESIKICGWFPCRLTLSIHKDKPTLPWRVRKFQIGFCNSIKSNSLIPIVTKTVTRTAWHAIPYNQTPPHERVLTLLFCTNQNHDWCGMEITNISRPHYQGQDEQLFWEWGIWNEHRMQTHLIGVADNTRRGNFGPHVTLPTWWEWESLIMPP